jgi:protein involved in polysaccharide export with SLBB domain
MAVTRRSPILLCALAVGLAATACALPPPEPPTSAQAQRTRIPLPTDQTYVLAAGDEIEVGFFRTPELNTREIIRPDGGISLLGLSDPRAREVQAANLTVHQLRDELKAAYRAELKNPDISVVVRTFGSNHVYVTGEVGKPGTVPLAGPMTALQAVLASEGFKSTARPTEVLLIRPTGAGKASWQLLNLGKVLGKADFSDDVPLAPHDIIYVPRSHIGNVDEFVDVYIRRLLPFQPSIQTPVL